MNVEFRAWATDIAEQVERGVELYNYSHSTSIFHAPYCIALHYIVKFYIHTIIGCLKHRPVDKTRLRGHRAIMSCPSQVVL